MSNNLVSWADWKEFVDANPCASYVEVITDTQLYVLEVSMGSFVYRTRIRNGTTEWTDYETNYKGNSPQTATVLTSGSGGPVDSVESRLKVKSSNEDSGLERELFSIGEGINMDDSDEDNPLLYIKNPTGSGNRILVWDCSVGVNVENNYALFKIFTNPTVSTNGTSIAPKLRRVGLTDTSIAEIYSIPTVTSNGDEIDYHMIGQNNNSASIMNRFSIIVYPGNSILLTGTPKSNNREAVITFIWAEDTDI